MNKLFDIMLKLLMVFCSIGIVLITVSMFIEVRDTYKLKVYCFNNNYPEYELVGKNAYCKDANNNIIKVDIK